MKKSEKRLLELKSVKLSIVVPAYNESGTIEKVVDVISGLDINKELIIVNDGSTDETKAILEKLKKKYKDIMVIHKKNGGKGTALREGFKYVTGEYTVVQDADFEYDPNDLITMLDFAIKNDADVIYGNRFATKRFFEGMDWKNFIGNNVILPALASILYGQIIHDEATCYKMFKTDVLKSIPLVCDRFEFCPEVTAKVRKKGYKIYEVPILYFPRPMNAGKKLNALKDGLEAIWTLIKYRFVN